MSRMTVCGLLAWVFLAGSAAASPMVGVTHINGHFLGMGGEFTLTPNAELAALPGEPGPFGGFCMEWSEDVAIDAAYEVTVNREALQGGYNSGLAGPLGGDPLDPRTAYLYWRFRAGTLAGYEYTPGDGRALSAQALQDVIWYLEDEQPRGWQAGSLQDAFYNEAQTAVDSGLWVGLGDVRVLNLWVPGHVGDLEYRVQDMLITVPVPAPGAFALVGLGSGLLIWRRRCAAES